MAGLKNVRQRRTDALTRVSWQQFETLLADYYRAQGYTVEHVGTGLSGAESDGGIDLKLRRDGRYVVVQCKHWNAKQVTHNPMHELLGVMLTEGATGAILVTSGEFTRAAWEKAQALPQITLIDGQAAREMLGPLLDEPGSPTVPAPAPSRADQPMARRQHVVPATSAPMAHRLIENAASRLICAAEDRIRYGGRSHRSRRRSSGPLTSLLGAFGAKLLVAAFGLIVMLVCIQVFLSQMHKTVAGIGPQSAQGAQRVAPSQRPMALQVAATPLQRSTEATLAAPPRQVDQIPQMSIGNTMSKTEQEEWKRKNAESMRILEATTPEL
ncbi:MAG: restriction endonuclease [Sphingobium sp.]